MPTSPRITSLPHLARNLTAVWFLLALENWSRYSVWYPRLRFGFGIGMYALGYAVVWWVVSWIVFAMIDGTAGMRRATALPIAGLVVLGCTLASIVVRGALMVTVGPQRFTMTLPGELEYLMRADFHPTLIWVMAIAALGRGLQWWYVEESTAVRMARLEAERAQAELSALAAQLEPHFLFNTLSGISTLASRDPAAAREMLKGLEELLLYTSHGADAVTLADEMGFAGHYLRLQMFRFPERLRVALEVSPPALGCVVPRLVLQPILENAIRHGIEQLDEGGTIAVAGQVEGGRLVLCVTNTDGGTARGASGGHGIGLASVRARLNLLYGPSHSFAINRDAAKGNVTVRLSMPERRSAA